MNAEDFQSLYKLLRGSKSAFAVLDARTLFIEKKLGTCLLRIDEARESYAKSRSRLMKQPAEKQVDKKAADADRQIKRIQRKQDKVNEILKEFDELLPKLKKLADREKPTVESDTPASNIPAPSIPAPSIPASSILAPSNAAANSETAASESGSTMEPGFYERPACRDDLDDLFIKRFNRIDGDEQLLWVGKRFGFREVNSQEDIHPDSLYFIKIGDEAFLVQTRAAEELADSVALISATSNLPMKTYTHEAFLRMGVRKRMVLLTIEFEHYT